MITIDEKPVELKENYNWNNFSYGDIVYLEDDNVGCLAAYFVSAKNKGVILRSLADDDAMLIIRCGADNLAQVMGA